jgi:hypothetical protein
LAIFFGPQDYFFSRKSFCVFVDALAPHTVSSFSLALMVRNYEKFALHEGMYAYAVMWWKKAMGRQRLVFCVRVVIFPGLDLRTTLQEHTLTVHLNTFCHGVH